MSIFGRNNSSTHIKNSARSRPAATRSSYSSGVDDFAEELDGITAHPLDEDPDFHQRPSSAGTSYVEAMGEERSKEQTHLFTAAGENLSRPHQEERAGHGDAANDEEFLIKKHEPIVELVWNKYQLLLEVLGDAYVRRHPRERHWYIGRMAFLLTGDLVGVAGGAIILGEIPWLAVLQAMAAAVAAVTSGLLGSDIKDSRLARQRKRDPESIPDEHKGFAHLFQGPDAGEYLVKLMVFGSLFIVVLLGVGILELRTSTEGSAAGLVFGCIAMAVGIASFVNSFHYSDELADKVETAGAQALKTNSDHQTLSALPNRAIVAKAQASENSIKKEQQELGEAAKHRVIAMVHAWHAERSNIFGHGFPADVVSVDQAPQHESTAKSEEKTGDLRSIIIPPSSNGDHAEAEDEAAS